MTPYGRRIQIEPEQQENVILSEGDNLVERGKVVAVGDKVEFCEVGDTILFTSFGVDSVELDGTKYRFMLEDDAFLLAKV